MQVNFGENEIKDLLVKVKIFNNSIGDYQLYTVNDQFQYFVKLDNGSIILSVDDLIDNQNQTLTPAKLQALALKFKSNSVEPDVKAQKETVIESKVEQEKKFQQTSMKYESVSHKKPMTFLRKLSLTAGILLLAFLAFAFYQSGNETPYLTLEDPKTEEELKQELLQREKENPLDYVEVSYTWRVNLIGNTIIEGSIKNNASLAGFKNVVLKVNFLSKTDVLLDSEEFTIMEFIPANETISFKYKISHWTSGVSKSNFDIISIEPY